MKNRRVLQKNFLGFRVKMGSIDLKKKSEKYFESQIAKILKKGLSLPIKSFSL